MKTGKGGTSDCCQVSFVDHHNTTMRRLLFQPLLSDAAKCCICHEAYYNGGGGGDAGVTISSSLSDDVAYSLNECSDCYKISHPYCFKVLPHVYYSSLIVYQ